MLAPQVTVLMPVYNAEKFLRKAIDSVLSQTFSHFEFLIVDDGSSDKSISIIESYKDERIRLIRNERNLGVTATLNKGIEQASAEFIARMDADDVSYPHRLQLQFDFIKAHPDVALISGWTRVINERDEELSVEKLNPNFYYYFQTYVCWIYHPTVMFRKQAVQEIGGYSAKYSEDFELFRQLLRRHRFHNLSEIILDYRITGQNVSMASKKDENNEAQNQQARDNINFYTEREYPITYNQIECLRYNFDHLLKEGDLKSILYTLKAQKEIAEKIAEKENLNCVPEQVYAAAHYHRQHIISFYILKLSRWKSLQLVYHTSSWRLFFSIIKNSLAAKISGRIK